LIFGHKSVRDSLIPWYGYQNIVSEPKKIKCSKIKYQKNQNFIFMLLSEDAHIQCFVFLNAYELTVVSMVCKSFNTTSQLLWPHLKNSLLLSVTNKFEVQESINLSWVSSSIGNQKHCFFALAKLLPITLTQTLKNTHKIIIIRGEVFDLSDFFPNHPGGSAILGEWSNSFEDASRPFALAHHSSIALSLAKTMLIWSPLKFLGRRGSIKYNTPPFVK
jgi:cytochrome b involved in lipid metabolism